LNKITIEQNNESRKELKSLELKITKSQIAYLRYEHLNFCFNKEQTEKDVKQFVISVIWIMSVA